MKWFDFQDLTKHGSIGHDERFRILQKAFAEYWPRSRRPTSFSHTAAAGVPGSMTVAEPATLTLDAGVDLSIRQGLGYFGPNGHLRQVISHTHRPIEMLPSFVHQGSRV